MSEELRRLLETFQWESEAQQKGMMALAQYLKRAAAKEPGGNLSHDQMILLICAWFIQKDHESSCWFIEHIANQTDPFQKKVQELEFKLQALYRAFEREKKQKKRKPKRGR